MAGNEFAVPIMPIGSGVADLEVAREQGALASGEMGQAAPPKQVNTSKTVGGRKADPAAESEAHPN